MRLINSSQLKGALFSMSIGTACALAGEKNLLDTSFQVTSKTSPSVLLLGETHFDATESKVVETIKELHELGYTAIGIEYSPAYLRAFEQTLDHADRFQVIVKASLPALLKHRAQEQSESLRALFLAARKHKMTVHAIDASNLNGVSFLEVDNVATVGGHYYRNQVMACAIERIAKKDKVVAIVGMDHTGSHLNGKHALGVDVILRNKGISAFSMDFADGRLNRPKVATKDGINPDLEERVYSIIERQAEQLQTGVDADVVIRNATPWDYLSKIAPVEVVSAPKYKTVNRKGEQRTLNALGQLDSFNDQPAYMAKDGSMYWYKDGTLHREGGPAVIEPGKGRVSYKWYTLGRFERETALKEAQLEVAGR